MILETKRLILRPWKESDVEDSFEFAKDPKIGPIAGWPPHKNIEESLEIIRNVLSDNLTFAVVLKKENRAVGCIDLKMGEKNRFNQCRR